MVRYRENYTHNLKKYLYFCVLGFWDDEESIQYIFERKLHCYISWNKEHRQKHIVGMYVQNWCFILYNMFCMSIVVYQWKMCYFLMRFGLKYMWQWSLVWWILYKDSDHYLLMVVAAVSCLTLCHPPPSVCIIWSLTGDWIFPPFCLSFHVLVLHLFLVLPLVSWFIILRIVAYNEGLWIWHLEIVAQSEFPCNSGQDSNLLRVYDPQFNIIGLADYLLLCLPAYSFTAYLVF